MEKKCNRTHNGQTRSTRWQNRENSRQFSVESSRPARERERERGPANRCGSRVFLFAESAISNGGGGQQVPPTTARPRISFTDAATDLDHTASHLHLPVRVQVRRSMDCDEQCRRRVAIEIRDSFDGRRLILRDGKARAQVAPSFLTWRWVELQNAVSVVVTALNERFRNCFLFVQRSTGWRYFFFSFDFFVRFGKSRPDVFRSDEGRVPSNASDRQLKQPPSVDQRHDGRRRGVERKRRPSTPPSGGGETADGSAVSPGRTRPSPDRSETTPTRPRNNWILPIGQLKISFIRRALIIKGSFRGSNVEMTSVRVFGHARKNGLLLKKEFSRW